MADTLIGEMKATLAAVPQAQMKGSTLILFLQQLNSALTPSDIQLVAEAAGIDLAADVDYEAFVRFLYNPVAARKLPPPKGEFPPCAACIRFIQITDVYTLENFPSLKTLVAEKRQEAAANGVHTYTMLTGDFLAPYLLSSLDHGQGMMSMINKTPIDILTWGNHDGNDMPHKAVMAREKEFKGVWINTNMTGHESFATSTSQCDKKIYEFCSVDGSNRRSVGLLGILTAGPGLYKANAFGGAKIEDPWKTMAKYKKKLEDDHNVDLVLPLCHLYEHQDERTCKEFDFPLIISGHDHHVVDRVISGTRVLKAGQDARCAWVVDIIWDSAAPSCKPRIEAELLEVTRYKPDEALTREVSLAYATLEKMQGTQLAMIPQSLRPLTSFGSRNRHVTMGTFLCSATRDAFNFGIDPYSADHCDSVLLKGANVRGGKDYADNEHFSLEALLSETQEEHMMHIFELPGRCIKVGLRETWHGANPGWMQYSDDVKIDTEGYVTAIAGGPLDEERIYRIASVKDLARENDGPTIGAYLSADPANMPDLDAGMPWRPLLLGYFASKVWETIWDALDKNQDGVITLEELQAIDVDHNGKLDRKEIMEAIKTICGLQYRHDETSFVDEVLKCAGDENNDKVLSLDELNTARSSSPLSPRAVAPATRKGPGSM